MQYFTFQAFQSSSSCSMRKGSGYQSNTSRRSPESLFSSYNLKDCKINKIERIEVYTLSFDNAFKYYPSSTIQKGKWIWKVRSNCFPRNKLKVGEERQRSNEGVYTQHVPVLREGQLRKEFAFGGICNPIFLRIPSWNQVAIILIFLIIHSIQHGNSCQNDSKGDHHTTQKNPQPHNSISTFSSTRVLFNLNEIWFSCYFQYA